ncbi:hypothetical protein [Plebeiibacterium marinum]|uniref:asparagine synthase (glutamine-hydrolyzing) n=1 Tax=Plebeiibacterium marinum TaxID=2992111 RepID=A0AAE3SKR7_9BACT|nr:hypothetical protein [Plebeiobacterium marinum]MCW3805810.1 hypothetical protein [Plebeiobacterium marinum]
MGFIFSSIPFSESKKIGDIYFAGNVIKKDHLLIAIKGFIYPEDYSESELIDIYINSGIDELSKLNGEFSIVIYDLQSDLLKIVNDKIGRNSLFVYKKDEQFLVADNFWNVLSVISPKEEDVSVQSVKEWLYLFFPLQNKTIIKNLEYFPSASIGEFDFKTKLYKKSAYWSFSEVTIDESIKDENVLDEFYSLIDNGIKFIKNKHGKDKVYACSVSGGLDSRISPYFCLSNKMKTISFSITSGKYSIFPFVPRLRKIVKKIAQFYGIKHYFIDDKKTSFEQKMFLDIKNLPFGHTNIHKTVAVNVPYFDVHINAGGPEMMSSTLTGIQDVKTSKDFSDYILSRLSLLNCPKPNFEKRFFKRLKAIVGIKEIFPDKLGIADQDMLSRGLMNYKIEDDNEINYFTYLYQQIASKTGNGAFENLTGTKHSYSLFFPFATDFLARLKPEFRQSRIILKKFLIEKFPELSKIAHEHSMRGVYFESETKLSWGYQFLQKVLGRVRKEGVPGNQLKSRKYKNRFDKITSQFNPIFNKCLEDEVINQSKKYHWHLYLQIVKVKCLLDIIYNKEWSKYVDFDIES